MATDPPGVIKFIHLINQAVGRADIRHFQTDLIHIHTVWFFLILTKE